MGFGKENLVLRLQMDPVSRPEAVEFDLSLPDQALVGTVLASGRAGLADLVALARTLCDSVAQYTVARSDRQGQPVRCHKSCSACCHYMVPMSVPEVLRFERELSCLPTGQSRHVQAALLAAGRKLLAGSTQAGLATDQTSQWYESLGIVCPLACGGGCALYAGRPLACREHFATGRSAEPASAGCPGAEVLPLPVSVLEALADLSAQVQAMPLESIALPLALPWLEDNRSRLLRTWPAADLARTLVGILERQALRRLHAA